MNMIKILIASGLISFGAKQVYGDTVKVPDSVNPINIEQFQEDLVAPYDSLTVKVEKQQQEIERAESMGDTTGIRGLRSRTQTDVDREKALAEAVRSIGDSTYSKFNEFNTVISDGFVTAGEANNMLSEIELNPEDRRNYSNIAGGDAYVKLDGVVGRYNLDVTDFVLLANKEISDKDITPAESDYSGVKGRIGVGYTSNERSALTLGVRSSRFDLTLSGELPEESSDPSERTILATQRNRVTGSRFESVEERTRSVEEYKLEVLANARYELDGNTSFVIGTGFGGEFVNRENGRKVFETLYDRDDNAFGEPNVDTYTDKSSDSNGYVPVFVGVEHGYGRLNVGLQAKANLGIDNKEVRGTLTYEWGN